MHFYIALWLFLSVAVASAGETKDFFGGKSISAIIRKYERYHRNLSRKTCSSGQEHKYYRLLKEYRKQKYYVPKTPDDDVDSDIIEELLPFWKNKSEWIKVQLSNLKKNRRFSGFNSRTKTMEKRINKLLNYKKRYNFSESDVEKKAIKQKSVAEMELLRKDFFAWVDQYSFLLGYGFPVDHFSNRKKYEELKESDSKIDRLRMTRLYFKRKLYEDGTYNRKHTVSDVLMRSTFDMVALRLSSQDPFLAENLRFDLEWLIGETRRFIGKGYGAIRNRMMEWKKRSDKTFVFYQELLKTLETEEGRETAKTEIQRHSKFTFLLKEYVLKLQADVYQYWSQFPEEYQALFAIENILFNEVGGKRRGDEDNRRAIAQVVINRASHPEYSSLPASDFLYPYLKEKGKQLPESHWLNVLFKEGEFSFTYFYIPAVVKNFCPDRSRRAHSLRRSNLRVGIDLLRKPLDGFEALRYFSRVSMLGKIDMSEIWKDRYLPVPEEPGQKIFRTDRLRNSIAKRKYRYLYGFENSEGKLYHVVEIANTVYVLNKLTKDADFFHFRNPHEFSFFKPKYIVLNKK